jgi:hypothetical protein
MKRYLCVFVLIMLAWVPIAAANSPLNPSKSTRENLKALAGAKQPITVVLSNGKDYRARVGEVGNEAVVLTGIAGREFFDVLVDIDEIVAIEAQARQQ